MNVKEKSFLQQLKKYISFRGIDMVVHLKDGSSLQLNKNRKIKNNQIIHFASIGHEKNVCIDEILRIEMFTC